MAEMKKRSTNQKKGNPELRAFALLVLVGFAAISSKMCSSPERKKEPKQQDLPTYFSGATLSFQDNAATLSPARSDKVAGWPAPRHR